MSQRNSGYGRLPDDLYETPAWVTMALAPHMQGVRSIWEPACGTEAMVAVMRTWPGVKEVRSTDVKTGTDFLLTNNASACFHDAIITNPPYTMSEVFIEQALKLTKSWRGRVAMLLRTDYDHAKTRQRLFGRSTVFAKKIVLTSRIRWIPGSTGSPSFNHAWFVWDWTHVGDPVLKYHIEEDDDESTQSVDLHRSGQRSQGDDDGAVRHPRRSGALS